MTNVHTGVEDYNWIMDDAGHNLSHDPALTDPEIAALVSGPVVRSLTQALEEGRRFPEYHVINTGIYQISCRGCADAILGMILGYPYPPDPAVIMTVDIFAGDAEAFTGFINVITEIEAEERRAEPARRGDRVGMYINIC